MRDILIWALYSDWLMKQTSRLRNKNESIFVKITHSLFYFGLLLPFSLNSYLHLYTCLSFMLCSSSFSAFSARRHLEHHLVHNLFSLLLLFLILFYITPFFLFLWFFVFTTIIFIVLISSIFSAIHPTHHIIVFPNPFVSTLVYHLQFFQSSSSFSSLSL